MVDYQTWTSIGYAVAREKGFRLEGPGTQQNNRELVSLLAEVWRDRKDELSTASRSRARSVARDEIQVR